MLMSPISLLLSACIDASCLLRLPSRALVIADIVRGMLATLSCPMPSRERKLNEIPKRLLPVRLAPRGRQQKTYRPLR
jgi:hypothetical protein